MQRRRLQFDKALTGNRKGGLREDLFSVASKINEHHVSKTIGTGQSMWSLKRLTEGECVVLRLSGRIEGEHLVELNQLLASESGVRQIILDLEEVKLVDQDSVTFLADCQAEGVRLRKCPAYILEWIAREKGCKGGAG
jgi:hypothetical protein